MAPALPPAVFALWKNPVLCPTLYIASNTSAFLLKGADLMLPGVLVPPGGLQFGKNQAVSISVRAALRSAPCMEA